MVGQVIEVETVVGRLAYQSAREGACHLVVEALADDAEGRGVDPPVVGVRDIVKIYLCFLLNE